MYWTTVIFFFLLYFLVFGSATNKMKHGLGFMVRT